MTRSAPQPAGAPAEKPPAAGDVAGSRGFEELARLAVEVGAHEVEEEARLYAERLAEGRFYVACLGQFKRGKSTLLNALVGAKILPAGVPPVTSALTVLRHGSPAAARVRFTDGRAADIDVGSIRDYISEEENPENRKGVRLVEVFLPSPILEGGLCLVDTPGLGSVFRGNTLVTEHFLPHVDAALVVIGTDPPLSGDELGVVEDLAKMGSKPIFVLAKADRHSDDERREAVGFAERLLKARLHRPVGRIFEVSGAERLVTGTATRDLAALDEALATLARDAGGDLVRAAEARGLERLSALVLCDLEERRAALLRPVEETERRLEALRRCAGEAERSARELTPLFAAEQMRLRVEFEKRQEAFVPEAFRRARGELAAAAAENGLARGAAFRRWAFGKVQEIAPRHLERWRTEIQPVAERLYLEVTERFVRHANEFLERLAASAAPGADIAIRPLDPEVAFRARSRLYYTEIMTLTAISPLTRILDLLRSREGARRSALATANAYLARLLSTNSARIVNDLDDRVAESRRSLEAAIAARLREVVALSERALHLARARREEGTVAVEAELARIESAKAEVERLRSPAS